MSRVTNYPFFPEPPEQYDRQYMSQLTRAFSVFAQQVQNPGEGRFTKVVLTDLPTSTTGLEAGTLWNDSGTVKVVT